VYVIPCKGCPSRYVGQTGRNLDVRIREHKNCVRTANENSAVFRHIQNKDHEIDWTSAKFVYNQNSKKKRLIVESTLIK
jgi:hypothetical protein